MFAYFLAVPLEASRDKIQLATSRNSHDDNHYAEAVSSSSIVHRE